MAVVFTAIGAAAAKVGSIFAAGSTAASAGAGAVTISQVFSAGSALAAIGQGIAARKQAGIQAEFAITEAEQERAAGEHERRSLARRFRELRGEQDVIRLANGLDIGVGTSVDISDATARLADRDIETVRQNYSNRSAAARLRSRGLLAEGRSAMLGGFGKAASIGADAYQLTG